MKRLLYISLGLLTLVLLIVCILPKSNLENTDSVELSFVYGDGDIHVLLSDNEANRIISILDNNLSSSNIPACGFNENISLKAGDQIYGIALDTCSFVFDYSTNRSFTVSQNEIDHIHALFEKYGGFFPCV